MILMIVDSADDDSDLSRLLTEVTRDDKSPILYWSKNEMG